jgi:uncharacterized protein YkwD
VRVRTLILLVGLGIVALFVFKPELKQTLESTLLPADSADASSPQSPEPGDAGAHFLLPGSHLAFELMSAPQSHYLGELDEDDADLEFQKRVQELTDGTASYDPWLSRAARELAFQGALLSDSPPEAARSFILRSAGAPELSVAQVLVRATGEDPKVLDEAIARAFGNAPIGEGVLLVGIGEAATEGEDYDRRIVVVVARRNFDLQPTARSVGLDSVWKIRGRAPLGFREAQASVLYPNNEVVELPVALQGNYFSVDVPSGTSPGGLRLSIDGVGKAGPFKLLQLQAEVGGPPPSSFEVLVPAAESFDDIASAENFALERLNEDRRQLDLPPLFLDLALSEVARAHSEEMRDEQYFAHLSPNTGLAGDRLEQARYRASAHGENLALNDSIYEAQSSLMESVGHRRNIINTSMSHVGIGLARDDKEEGRSAWYLTQVFARKVLPFDEEQASSQFLERINRAREEADLHPLQLDEDLTEFAAESSREALVGPADDLPGRIAPRASRIAGASVAVSVHVFYDLEGLEPDATSLGESFQRVGIAFLHDEQDLHGRTFLVLIAAE